MSTLPEIQRVEGHVTFTNRKPRLGGPRFVTFSYSVDGQRFHKILDSGASERLSNIANSCTVGDKLDVWCLKSNPDVYGIGERPTRRSAFSGWISSLGDFLQIFS